MRQADLRLPLYQQVRDALARDIANRVWKPGEAIPTEAELVGRFHTSIGTIRKAVDQLVADEMVERRQGKGTFIKPANFQSSLQRFSASTTPMANTASPKPGFCTANS